MGRGAHQGEAGSFSMVLRSLQLDDLAGTRATADEIKGWVSSGEVYPPLTLPLAALPGLFARPAHPSESPLATVLPAALKQLDERTESSLTELAARL